MIQLTSGAHCWLRKYKFLNNFHFGILALRYIDISYMNFQIFSWNMHVCGYWTVVNITFWADVNVKCHKIQYWGEHNISAKFKFKFLETFKTWYTPVLLKTDLPQMTRKVFINWYWHTIIKNIFRFLAVVFPVASITVR